MASTKRKAVVNLEADQVERADTLIRMGRYASLSELAREAIAEKLDRLAQARVAEQVARYCANEADEDDDLVAAQAFEPEPKPRKKGKRR